MEAQMTMAASPLAEKLDDERLLIIERVVVGAGPACRCAGPSLPNVYGP